MANDSKFETQIEIKPPPPPPTSLPPSPPPPFSSDLPGENLQEPKLSFFRSRSRRGHGDTWIVSVFLILHVVAFVATMFVNDCSRNSNGDCALKALGRFSFQPLSENPLLGPSASTLDQMGALRRMHLTESHQIWRLFTFPCLHAGLIHLLINLSSVLFIGIYLEHEFGPLMVGIIYVLSAFSGTLVAALFVQNRPEVGSSGPLFGLVGAMFSELIRNRKMYTDKLAALASLLIVSAINLVLGLLPFVGNFSSIGGFISGILLGFVLLFRPEIRQVPENKAGLFEYKVKSSLKSKLKKKKLELSAMRSVSLLLFCVVFAGCLIGFLRGTDMNRYCKWCEYADCVPWKGWSCENKVTSCESMVSYAELTLTCLSNGNFRVFPYTNITQSRMNDLCNVICLFD
ncbi:hypothetical protein UlMin_035430 [Ulmus minor]